MTTPILIANIALIVGVLYLVIQAFNIGSMLATERVRNQWRRRYCEDLEESSCARLKAEQRAKILSDIYIK